MQECMVHCTAFHYSPSPGCDTVASPTAVTQNLSVLELKFLKVYRSKSRDTRISWKRICVWRGITVYTTPVSNIKYKSGELDTWIIPRICHGYPSQDPLPIKRGGGGHLLVLVLFSTIHIHLLWKVKEKVAESCPTLCGPHRLHSPWNFRPGIVECSHSFSMDLPTQI